MSGELAINVLDAQIPVKYNGIEYRLIQAVRYCRTTRGERITMLELVDRNGNCVVCAPAKDCEMII